MNIRFFGQYLLNKRLITVPQLVAAFEYQQIRNRLIGTYGIESGKITEEEVIRILKLQSDKDILFGQGAIELGVLKEDQLEELLNTQEDDHIHLGNALVALGYLKKEEIDQALNDFINEQAVYAEKAMSLPQEVKDRNIVLRFFDVTQKMLLRKWALNNKPIEIRLVSESLFLSDHNVKIDIEGEWNGQYILAVATDVTTQAAQQIVGTEHVTDEERHDLVAEFANVVCGHVVSKLSELGKEAMITPPTLLPPKYDLPNKTAVVLSLVSKGGLIFASVVY